MSSEHKGSEVEHFTVQALCAEHPERTAVGTCTRCGCYFCDACRGGARGFCRDCHASRGYVAWEDRSLSVLQRYFRTVKGTIAELPKFAADLPPDGGVGQPLVFAMVPTIVSALLGAGLLGALVAVMTYALQGTTPSAPAPMIGVFLFVVYGVIGVFAYLAYLAVWPGVLVLIARLFGNRVLSYRGAFRSLCYASGLNWLYWVPIVGLGVAVYHFVVSSVSIASLGRTSVIAGLAIFGVPAMLVGGTTLGLYLWFMIAMWDLPNQ